MLPFVFDTEEEQCVSRALFPPCYDRRRACGARTVATWTGSELSPDDLLLLLHWRANDVVTRHSRILGCRDILEDSFQIFWMIVGRMPVGRGSVLVRWQGRQARRMTFLMR